MASTSSSSLAHVCISHHACRCRCFCVCGCLLASLGSYLLYAGERFRIWARIYAFVTQCVFDISPVLVRCHFKSWAPAFISIHLSLWYNTYIYESKHIHTQLINITTPRAVMRGTNKQTNTHERNPSVRQDRHKHGIRTVSLSPEIFCLSCVMNLTG